MQYFIRYQLCVLVAFFLSSCNNERNKKEYKFTVKVCDSVFVETFNVFGNGATGGDIHSNYLTDSLNFRMFIGTYDNYNEGYNYLCDGDSILVEKKSKNENGVSKVIETKHLSLSTLRKKRVFE